MMTLFALGALAGEVEAVDVRFAWRFVDEALVGELSAPTTGWIAVGLSDDPTLDGSRLVMVAMVDGKAHVEEHIARPPAHPTREVLGGRSGLLSAEGRQALGRTTVRFAIASDPDDGLGGALAPGQAVHLTLAWSTVDAFVHHSARRGALTVEL